MTDVSLLPKIRVMDRDAQPVRPLERQDTGGSVGGRKIVGKDGPPLANGKFVAKLRSPAGKEREIDGSVQNGGGGGNSVESEQPPIDPLSQHILKRTNTSNLQRYKIPTAENTGQPTSPNDPHTDTKDGDKKKGVSFLSRFTLIGTKKKAPLDDAQDQNGSEAGDDHRPEGMDAQLFTHNVDNLGFNPKYPQPPAYIKVRHKFTKEKEFDHLFLAQELRSRTAKGEGANPSHQSGSAASQNPVWAAEFSKDGKFLAAGGQDKVLRVWVVLSTAEERRAHEIIEAERKASGGESTHLSAPVFQQKPYREYVGHESTILDLSWSKNNFLLSSSMDKTVRLWHLSRNENLCTFKHSDFVPSIQFHPQDDRFFLAGSLDTKLRLWSIPDKSVAYWTQLPDMITSVAFTPDGKTCIAGTLGGLCMFYDTEGLKFQSQIHVKSTRGQNAKGSKITGIQTKTSKNKADVKILVTSNDSRVRVYNMKDKSLETKLRAHANTCSQIRATFADDTTHIICGSEDRKAYIWSTSTPEGEKRTHIPVEMFEAHSSITTCAIMAPRKTRQLLSASEDPIFDLCNPPPVTLMSREHSVTGGSKPPTEAGGVATKVAKRSPAYISRTLHPDGNIIVTTDYTGSIKVFRQDCAYTKRMRLDNWDTASVFSKRTTGSKIRPSSIISRSGRSRRDSTATQPPDERIMSWRQDLALDGFEEARGEGSGVVTPVRGGSPRKRRSRVSGVGGGAEVGLGSPGLGPEGVGREGHPQPHPQLDTPPPPQPQPRKSRHHTIPSITLSTTASASTSPSTSPSSPPTEIKTKTKTKTTTTTLLPSQPPPSSSPSPPSSPPPPTPFDPVKPTNLTHQPPLSNPLNIHNGQSWAFWNGNGIGRGLEEREKEREREREREREKESRSASVGSRVTLEIEMDVLGGNSSRDREGEEEKESEKAKCRKCGEVEVRGRWRGLGGLEERVLVCGACGFEGRDGGGGVVG